MDEPAARLMAVADAVTATWARQLLHRTLETHGVAIESAATELVVDQVAHLVRRDLGDLLAQDPETQRSNPLTIFRRATVPMTAYLTELGLPPVARDDFARRSFPEDVYGLYPATWADISEDLVEPGLKWGAWKAAVVMARHRHVHTSADARDPSETGPT